MKRRGFIKLFAAAPLIPVLAKADVIGPDITMPEPIVPAEPCSFVPEVWSEKLFEQLVEAGRMLDEKSVPMFGRING